MTETLAKKAQEFQWQKLEIVNYTSPDDRKWRAVMCEATDGKFPFHWEGKTKDGKSIDIVAFIERGWRPVLELVDNLHDAPYWLYKNILMREKADGGYEFMDVRSLTCTSLSPVIEAVAMAGKFQLFKSVKEA